MVIDRTGDLELGEKGERTVGRSTGAPLVLCDPETQREEKTLSQNRWHCRKDHRERPEIKSRVFETPRFPHVLRWVLIHTLMVSVATKPVKAVPEMVKCNVG